MSIIASYNVDRELYQNPGTTHSITLVTTEYTHRNDVLVHLQIGKNLGIRLNNLLRHEFRKGDQFQNEQFLFKKSYGAGKPKLMTQNTFEDKLKRFDVSKTMKAQEILEEYNYTGRNGKPDMVQIAVTIKNEAVTAIIEFKDAEQHENFIEPAWLVKPDSRSL